MDNQEHDPLVLAKGRGEVTDFHTQKIKSVKPKPDPDEGLELRPEVKDKLKRFSALPHSSLINAAEMHKRQGLKPDESRLLSDEEIRDAMNQGYADPPWSLTDVSSFDRAVAEAQRDLSYPIGFRDGYAQAKKEMGNE